MHSDAKWQKEEGIKSQVIPVLYQNKSENRNRGEKGRKKVEKGIKAKSKHNYYSNIITFAPSFLKQH